MTVLQEDIAAFDAMRAELEAEHLNEWAVFHHGQFLSTFPDFQAAASAAMEAFDDEAFLIRQVGVERIQLSGGMTFIPAHVLGPGGV